MKFRRLWIEAQPRIHRLNRTRHFQLFLRRHIMARFAAQTTQNKTPNAVNAFNLPAQQGLSLADLISTGAYRMVVSIERLVARH